MPESANHKIPINLNLLRPQSENPKKFSQFFHWLLFAGRYIVIFVEIIVFAAFIARFKFDYDISETQGRIDEQVGYIESLKNTEIEARQLQFQISQIRSLKDKTPNLGEILKHLADQTPTEIVLSNLITESADGRVGLKISGDAKDNNQVSAMINGLSQDPFFSEATLSTIGLEQGTIKFVIVASVKGGGK